MENREISLCQYLVDYMTGELSDVERKRFERHLDTCASCREDAAEWRLVWERLSEEAEPQELPPDLKDEVMESLFGPSTQNDETGDGRKADRSPMPFMKRLAAAALLVIVFAAGFLARGWMPAAEEAQSTPAASPVRIERILHLTPVASAREYLSKGNAYGVACILNNNGEQRLAVYVFGTSQTSGSQAYHVWLLKDGERSSAGTFTVGASGIGLLTVPWPEQALAFDQVGITLEPNAGTMTPQGPQIFGSAPSAEG